MISLTRHLTRDGISVRILTGFLLLFITILFLLPGFTAQGQGDICVEFETVGNPKYNEFPASRFITGLVDLYSDPACNSAIRFFNAGFDGTVYAPDQETAAQVCNANNGSYNYASHEMTAEGVDNIWWCDPSAPPPTPLPTETPVPIPAAPQRRQRQSSNWSPPVVPPPPPVDPRPTGVILNEDTDMQLSAFNGLGSGIEFQRLDAGGIGIQSMLDLGFLDAVDVRSNIGDGYEVCFPQSGHIVFLDAAGMPRMPELGEPYTRDGHTCASYTRAGTVVLLSRLE